MCSNDCQGHESPASIPEKGPASPRNPEVAGTGPPPPFNSRPEAELPELSAEEFHRIVVKAHVAGNLTRRKFAELLLRIHESRIYLQLGFSSIFQYGPCCYRDRA